MIVFTEYVLLHLFDNATACARCSFDVLAEASWGIPVPKPWLVQVARRQKSYASSAAYAAYVYEVYAGCERQLS